MSKRGTPPPKARSPQALLRDRVREFCRPLPKALAGDEDAVHDLRIAARRLRVAIRALPRKPQGRRAKESVAALQVVTRLAGMSRDLDVAVELWAKRGGEAPGTPAGERRLRASLRAGRIRARVHMADALLDSDLARLRRTLRQLVTRGAADRAEILRRIAETGDSTGTEIRNGFAAIGDTYDPAVLHLLRRRCRRLRYAAEIACALHGEDSEVPGLFKRLQEMLGALHDRHVLGVWLVARGISARRRGHVELADAADAEARWAENQAREHHRKALEKKPQTLAARALGAFSRLVADRVAQAGPPPPAPSTTPGIRRRRQGVRATRGAPR